MYHYGAMFRLLHNAVSQELNNALAAMELTGSQGHLLGYLARCENPPCPKDIEERLQLSHPTVSGLLSRLEKKEFIRLEPDPADGRCKRIYIAPKGAACMQSMRTAIAQTEAQIVQGFTPEEQQTLAGLLTRAAHNMGDFPPEIDSKEDSQP